MKIKKMTATFGNLIAQTLELEDGINIFTMPNESGKSTWSAFIVAMFYGIDSSERDSTSRLAEKNRYRPWNGASPAGVMELEVDGTPVTIERSSSNKGFFNVFTARNSLSGAVVPNLSGENCGLQLLGVPRGVFERSAFVRQSGTAFDHDNDLERKLLSLVTTGEEGMSYSEVEGQLQKQLRRLRFNKGGELPTAEAALYEVNIKLENLKVYNQKNVEQTGRIERLTIDKAECEGQLSAMRRYEESEALRRFRETEGRLASLKDQAAKVEASFNDLPRVPTAKEVGAMLRGLDVLSDLESSVETDCKQLLEPAQKPEYTGCPLLEGLSADEARRTIKEETEKANHLGVAAKVQKLLPPILWLVSAVAVIAGLIVAMAAQSKTGYPILICGGVLAVLTLAYYLGVAKKAVQKALADQAAIYAAYGAKDITSMQGVLESYLAYLTRVETLETVSQTSVRRAKEIRADLENKRTELFKLINSILPHCSEPSSARAELERIGEVAAELENLNGSISTAEQVRGALLPSVSDIDESYAGPLENPGFDKKAIEGTLARINRELAIQTSNSGINKGEAKAIGDPAFLAAEKLRLERLIERMEKEYKAIELALEALKDANAELQNRFSPAINERAGEIMQQLTGGRYTGVVFERTMGVSAVSVDDLVSHDTRSFSKGTVDQLYLAVRLAICDLALPTDRSMPMVFDDAFVSFDDQRLKLALEFLKLESSWRQTIIFSCQDREKLAL